MLPTHKRRERLIFWVLFATAAALLLVVAPRSLSGFNLNLLGKFLTFAIVALGLDLIWGYGGMLSLGQGLFFTLGGYSFAMYLKLEASGTSLPDFMDWSGATSLPLFWWPFHSPEFAIAMAILVPAAVASAIGYLIFRSRVQGVYFSIITQALTVMASILFVGQQSVTGGTNGITDLSVMFGHSLSDDGTLRALYMTTAVCLGASYLFCRWLTGTRFGRLLAAVRDDENRARFLGYNPVTIKTAAFAISAALAGLAGALFVPQVGIISPSAMDVTASVDVVIWVAIGGRGTLIGPIIGALLVNWGKSSVNDAFPDKWQFFMGALFIGSVLLFPQGIAGYLRMAVGWIARRSPAPASATKIAVAASDLEPQVEIASKS